MNNLTQLSDAELTARRNAAQANCDVAWSAWERVRDAGETALWCAEFQAHNVAQQALDPLFLEIGRRDMARKLALFGPAPMSDWDSERAWIEGPGSDAQ